jgi:hypothetical protein
MMKVPMAMLSNTGSSLSTPATRKTVLILPTRNIGQVGASKPLGTSKGQRMLAKEAALLAR